MLSYDTPLFTVSAPSSFLVRQALDDLATGRTVVVISPHRRILEQIGQQTGGASIYWLDAENSRKSSHLAIVTAEEWAALDVETAIQTVLDLLANLGLDVGLPSVGDFTCHLVRALADSAHQLGRDLAFSDLYNISLSTETLRTFLIGEQDPAADSARELLVRLDSDEGYIQAVSVLSAIRSVFKPLGAGPLHTLCQPPFLSANQLLRDDSLLLVPLTNADFPEHDHLLSAMLDLTLNRVLTTADDARLSLHLHDPHLYRNDRGRRWIEHAHQDSRLALLLDVQTPDNHVRREGCELVFRCSEALASTLITDWSLTASISDLMELPGDTAVAQLPSMVVTLKVSDE
jgi:hypothetical protein